VTGCGVIRRDLTDEQWRLLEPETQGVMAELRKRPGGAPMSHDLRAMLDAIGYVTRYGIEWRALPVDFPPWSAVYAFFERWSTRDLPRRLADRLRGRIRIACGRAELPTAAVIDAQTSMDTAGDAYDQRTDSWHYVSEVDVRGSGATGTVVAFGDSITDGYASTFGADRRWPDLLGLALSASSRRARRSLLSSAYKCYLERRSHQRVLQSR
jgi:transposase